MRITDKDFQKKTWGHRLEKIPPEEMPAWATRCSRSKCKHPPTHFSFYSYVTGQKGRSTTRRSVICDVHAAQFRKQHLTEQEGES